MTLKVVVIKLQRKNNAQSYNQGGRQDQGYQQPSQQQSYNNEPQQQSYQAHTAYREPQRAIPDANDLTSLDIDEPKLPF